MIMGRQSGLGRGLGALIPPKSPQPASGPVPVAPSAEATASAMNPPEPTTLSGREIHHLPVEKVDPNPHQPRSHFDHAHLEDLIASIQEHGVLQPIVVSHKSDGRYELIAGERRLRASKIAGLDVIPAIIRTVTDQQKLELAIIENIQRQDLNALEEGESYLRLQNEFNLTQEEVAKKVGKSRSQVANTVRLLQLPPVIKQALVEGKISASNARTLLSLESDTERIELFERMLAGNFTVRQAEARIPNKRQRRMALFDPNVTALEEQLRASLGSKVTVKRDARGEGEIRITFLNDEDLHSITKKIVGE
jgi:ParB family transcriptional regulator, chromosome partitioning protein